MSSNALKYGPRPDKVMVITFKWIYKVKLDELGEHGRLPNGFEDCVLNGNLREEVYVSQPKGFVDTDNPNHVYKLKKALYGLKQDPRAWYDMLSLFLISQDFSKGSVDPALFICRNDNDLLLVQIYVDDIIFAASTPELSKHIDIRYHFIKEHVENGVIELYFFKTEYQLADIFTKSLGIERIEFLINKLGMRSFTPETLKQLTDEVDETMDMTIDQQVALDEALVPHASRLRIGKSNFRLISDITSKESTLQVEYDVLRLTSFYKEFLVTADTFDELPFEEQILTFLRYLRHSGEIKKITDMNVDFAYLLLEDFVYQVEHKDAKKSNEMYYPRFTKFGAILPVELTNEDIRNSATYKEYYAIASGATPLKMK
nr:copia protein [Tanacetum cinerariifolium]